MFRYDKLRGGEKVVPIFKRCDRCGKRLSPGVKCRCVEARRQFEYDTHARDRESNAFYHSKEWLTASRAAKEYYHGIDIVELYENDMVVNGRTVHHLIPIKTDWSRRLDKNNLIYLTESNHQLIHQRMEKEGVKPVAAYLHGLIMRWREEMYGT